jgi:hypothetical protein
MMDGRRGSGLGREVQEGVRRDLALGVSVRSWMKVPVSELSSVAVSAGFPLGFLNLCKLVH